LVLCDQSDGSKPSRRTSPCHVAGIKFDLSDDERRGELENLMADFSCASTKRTSQAPMSCEEPVRFRVSVVVAAVVLTGCNTNQEVNLSSRTAPGVVAGSDYNTYNPISYAQNNTGNRSAGR
jgi:hypothetical protein